MGTGTVGNIIVNAHREGIGVLEYHANFLGQIVHIGRENVLTIVRNLAGDFHRGNQVIHPVQSFQESGLTAAGGTDQSGDGLFGDIYIDMLQGLSLTIPEVQVLDSNNRLIHSSLLYTAFFF